tara:strand:+ start:423 stop:617 length:195 start_codon:yes stop_codon:yes gene_type:complete
MTTLPLSIVKLLRYSWQDINFNYELLTDAEKQCVPEGEFNLIVERIRRYDETMARSVTIEFIND